MKVDDILQEDGKSVLKQAYTKPAAAPQQTQVQAPQQPVQQAPVQQTQQVQQTAPAQQPAQQQAQQPQQLPQVDPQFQQQAQPEQPANPESELETSIDYSHLFGKMPVGQAPETDLRNLALTFAAIAKQHNKLGAAPDKKVLYKGGIQSANSALSEVAPGRIEVKTNYTLHKSIIGDSDIKGPIAMIIGTAFGQNGDKERIMKIIIEQCKKAFRENVSHADSVVVGRDGVAYPGKYRLIFKSGHAADVIMVATANKPVHM
ncbi:hypothetical protein RsoM2USA_346 [Ralstonia phage RsoM2USA]|nr:hypothetical protein RsoM2USA_346 [Ralstonia phage RsoM2USA]